MILKSSILAVAMVSGLFASENPFAIEKNIQKIEKEEDALLQSLSKEKPSLESDDIPEQSAPIEEAKREEAAAPVPAPAVSQNVPISTEKSAQPTEKTLGTNEKIEVKADAEQPKAVVAKRSNEENLSAAKKLPVLAEENQSEQESAKSIKGVTKEAATLPATPPAQTQEAKKDILPVKSTKTNIADESSVKSETKKKEALQTIESQVEKIDAKIAELESKLKKSRESVMSGDKNEEGGTPLAEVVKPESAKAVEPARDSAFKKELQEAIQSVQN